MDEIMSKILKKFVCENGDCRSNEFKIGPLISLIAVNILIAASLAVFIDKMIWNGTRYNCNDRSEYLRRSVDAFIKRYQMRRVIQIILNVLFQKCRTWLPAWMK